MESIYIDKVVLNIGIGSNEDLFQNAKMLLEKLSGGKPVLGCGYGIHDPAYTTEHIDRWIVIFGCQVAGENDVPVEDGANGVRDGFRQIVGLDKYCVEARDGPALGRAGALHQLW